ncbi:DUF7282 domain-containing protein [Halalkalicoccus salilacus]|uniref:DUF7282 domain-containing protein n=1 Tax=Halalkalicoccus sp. GCM10025704 TaxID=3252662 RepID=UPI00361E377D
MPENTDAVDAGTTVDGTLTNEEEAWYTIDLDAEDTISVVFDSAFGDWTDQRVEISISDPDGAVLRFDGGARGRTPADRHRCDDNHGRYPRRGDRVSGGEISYSVLIDVADQDPYEPNNTRESATEIATGESVDSVVVGDEADWFAVDAVAGEGIELDLTAHDLALNRDIEMTLFDPDGNEIGEIPRDRPYGVYSTQAALDFNGLVDSAIGADVAEENGSYHIRVRGVDGSVRGFTAYTLIVETVELDQYDPNERRETATPLTPGETIEAIAVGYDHDWYRFDAEEGDVIMINYEVTQFTDLYDPEFTLYDPQGNVIHSDIAPPRTVTAATTGTYHLHIAQEDETTPAAFRNRLGYALTVRLNEEVPPPAGVAFTDQDSDGTRVVIDEVTVPESGFVAIYDKRLITGEDLVEGIRGVSPFLETGSHDQVAVTLADPITETQRLWALTHRDTNDTREFDFSATAGDEDEPYEGETTLVMDDACITIT